MSKRIVANLTVVLATSALGVIGLAGTASAHPALNLSFAASHDGASAHWSAGKNSPIDLTVGSNSPTTYALITLHHLPAKAVSSLDEPTFATDNYNAGSPRWYITLSNGDALWGYPPDHTLSLTDFTWEVICSSSCGSQYKSWSGVQSYEGNAAVTGAWVIADGDQSPGTTDVITGLTFNQVAYN